MTAFFPEDPSKNKNMERETSIVWRLWKGKDGPTQKVGTEGYFCPDQSSVHYRINDEVTYALVGEPTMYHE